MDGKRAYTGNRLLFINKIFDFLFINYHFNEIGINIFMKVEQFFKKSSEIINTVAEYFTVLLIASFTIVIFVSVLCRYVFNFPIIFSVEISKLSFVWACFFAATVAYKRKVHIRFEFSTRILGEKGVNITNLIIHFLTLIFFVLMFIKSIIFIGQIWETYFPVTGISQGWLYISEAVSLVVFICHNLALLIESWKVFQYKNI